MHNLVFVSMPMICIFITAAKAYDETISFSAIKGERNGPYISYQTLLVNNSANFRPNFGAFICSEPGIYYFTFNILAKQNSELRVSLRTNRIPVVTAFSGSKTAYHMGSATALLQLEPEDIVYCFIEDGDFYESVQVNRAYTSFSGFKIGNAKTEKGGFLSALLGRDSSGNKSLHSDLSEHIDKNDYIFDLIKNSTRP